MSTLTYLPASADSLARLHTAEAVGALVDVMRNGKPAERMRAAELIIERGHGKAVQAVISVPARQAIASKLAALDDAALLAIASAGRLGGVRGENEGPNVPCASAGPIQQTAQGISRRGEGYPQDGGGYGQNNEGRVPLALRHDDIVDGEFDDTDPCS